MSAAATDAEGHAVIGHAGVGTDHDAADGMAQACHATLGVDATMAGETARPQATAATRYAAVASSLARWLDQMHGQLVEQAAMAHARLRRDRLRRLRGQAIGIAATAHRRLVLLHHVADAAQQCVVGQPQAGMCITAQGASLLCDHIAVGELQRAEQRLQATVLAVRCGCQRAPHHRRCRWRTGPADRSPGWRSATGHRPSG